MHACFPSIPAFCTMVLAFGCPLVLHPCRGPDRSYRCRLAPSPKRKRAVYRNSLSLLVRPSQCGSVSRPGLRTQKTQQLDHSRCDSSNSLLAYRLPLLFVSAEPAFRDRSDPLRLEPFADVQRSAFRSVPASLCFDKLVEGALTVWENGSLFVAVEGRGLFFQLSRNEPGLRRLVRHRMEFAASASNRDR